MHGLAKRCQIVRVLNAAVAGTTDLVGTAINIQGFDGVMFISLLGTLTATQVTKILVEGSDDNSTYVTINAGTAPVDTDDDKVMFTDVYRPGYKWVRATLDRLTANAVHDGMIAILYHAGNKPVIQGSTVSATGMNYVIG